MDERLLSSALDVAVDSWATPLSWRFAICPYQVFTIGGNEWLQKGKANPEASKSRMARNNERKTVPWRSFAKDQPDLVEE